MAHYFPRSPESLLDIHGVGRSKLERYGDEFIQIIEDYCARHAVTGSPPPPKARAKAPDDYRHREVGRAFNNGMEIDVLMERFGVAADGPDAPFPLPWPEEGTPRAKGSRPS